PPQSARRGRLVYRQPALTHWWACLWPRDTVQLARWAKRRSRPRTCPPMSRIKHIGYAILLTCVRRSDTVNVGFGVSRTATPQSVGAEAIRFFTAGILLSPVPYS